MTRVKLINLTAHPIRIAAKTENGTEVIEIPRSHTAGVIASEWHKDTLEVQGKCVELIGRKYFKSKGIPPRQKGVMYIVSEKTALMRPREDFVVPVRVRKKKGKPPITMALASVSVEDEAN